MFPQHPRKSPASECPQKAAGKMSRGALTFSETAKVMHITFACLLCKISNELETPSFCPRLGAHLKTQQHEPGCRASQLGCAAAVSCFARFYPDATLITGAKTAQKNHSCSWRPKEEEENPRERGAPLPPQPHLRAGWHWAGRGQVPLDRWLRRAGGHWSF